MLRITSAHLCSVVGYVESARRVVSVQAPGIRDACRRWVLPIVAVTKSHWPGRRSLLVMKTVPEACGYLSRAVEVCTAERIALVEQKVRVSHVQGGHDYRPLLSECLATLKTRDRVSRLVSRPVALEKAGAVSDRARHPGARREFHIHASRQRVALIVVEEKELV